MNIKSKIESLLFISAKPMSVKQLAEVIKAKEEEVASAGDELVAEYQRQARGVQIIKNAGKYQMVSAAENAPLIQEFLKDETSGELSRPSLEALTIIAYRGPISKIDLERIRGVNCSLIIRNLLMRGLIEEKNQTSKEESLYSVTMDFVRFLGISNLTELPDYERLSKDETIDKIIDKEDEDTMIEEKKE